MRFLLSIFLSFFSTTAFAKEFFSCEKTYKKQSMFLLVYERQGSIVARADYGTGTINTTVKIEKMTSAEAQKEELTEAMATTLKVKWADVHSVKTYTTKEHEDDAAGAMGVAFFNSSDKLIDKGMYVGWSPPLKCDKVTRKPISN